MRPPSGRVRARIRHTPSDWIHFDGKCWERNGAALLAQEAMKEMVTRLADSGRYCSSAARDPRSIGASEGLPGSLAQRVLQPDIEAAEMAAQTRTHGAHRELIPMADNERAPHFASLAK